MSSHRINHSVPQSCAVGSALELVVAVATAALIIMMLASPLLAAGAATEPATSSAVRGPAVTYVTLPAVVVVGRPEVGTTTVAGLELVKAAPNQVNLAQ